MFTRSGTKSLLITKKRGYLWTNKNYVTANLIPPLVILNPSTPAFYQLRGLLRCLQGQSMTNIDGINRKQSLSLVLSLHSLEETKPFQWVTQTRTQAGTRSWASIKLYLPTWRPKPLACQRPDWKQRETQGGFDYDTHLLSAVTSLIRTKSGYLMMCKRKPFLSYFTSH